MFPFASLFCSYLPGDVGRKGNLLLKSNLIMMRSSPILLVFPELISHLSSLVSPHRLSPKKKQCASVLAKPGSPEYEALAPVSIEFVYFSSSLL
jgi:hypothetical protein